MFLIAEICILISYAISVLLPINLTKLTDEVLYGGKYSLLPEIIRNYVLMFLIATVALNKGAMELNQTQFNAAIEKIVTALKTAGYDPYAQLTGYVETGQENYITRQGGAREMVLRLDVEQIKDFLKTYNK